MLNKSSLKFKLFSLTGFFSISIFLIFDFSSGKKISIEFIKLLDNLSLYKFGYNFKSSWLEYFFFVKSI